MPVKGKRLSLVVITVLLLFGAQSVAQSSTMQALAVSRLPHHRHAGQLVTRGTTNEAGTSGFRFLAIDVPNAQVPLPPASMRRGPLWGSISMLPSTSTGFY